MRARDDWETIFLDYGVSRGTHELLSQVAMNVSWANSRQDLCFDYQDSKFVADVARGMDALRAAPGKVTTFSARHGHVDSVSVDATMTSSGSLRVDVNLVSSRTDEDGGVTLGDGLCVASFDGVERLFEGAAIFREGATGFEDTVQARFRSDMAKVFLVAWRRFEETLSRSFDVHARGGLTLRELSDDEVSLVVETCGERDSRLGLEAEARAAASEAAAAQEAERTRVREAEADAACRVDAQTLVGRFQGDVELLILRALATQGPGCGLAIQKAFREAGFEFAAPRAGLKAYEVALALDLLRPGWRDADRVVEPLPAVQTVRQRQGKDKPRG